MCYNFMPVFDWLRSELEHKLPDGSFSLAYDDKAVLGMDPFTNELSLPGWDESYKRSELQNLISRYRQISEEELWENLSVFLRAVVPVAEKAGIRMAIHPDDPPWGIFGLPRIITDAANIRRLLGIVESPANCLTFCTGSLGASENNDLVQMASEFSSRIAFLHMRNILRTDKRCFEEVAHPTACGSLDMKGIASALLSSGFDGYVRPDHGRMIWGEAWPAWLRPV